MFQIRIFIAKVAVPVNFESKGKLGKDLVVCRSFVGDPVPADDELEHMHIALVEVHFQRCVPVPTPENINERRALVVEV